MWALWAPSAWLAVTFCDARDPAGYGVHLGGYRSYARAPLADPKEFRVNEVGKVRFRLIVGVGALVAGVFSGVARSATIRPVVVAAGPDAFCSGAACLCGSGAFIRWAGT